MSVFTLTSGVDNFTGNPNETNEVFFTSTTLQSTDTITGGATGSFFDILTLTAGGTVAAGQFAGVTNFELLNLSSAGNTVSLTSGLVGGSSKGIFSVVGGSGNDTVDASAVSNGMRIAFFAGAGADHFIGGNGNDYVEFAAAELSAADTVAGGNGFDFLAFSTGGAIGAAALANISSIEEVLLSNAGNSITLSNAFVAGADNGVMSIVDGTGNDTIDASAVTNGTRVAFYTSSGNETFIGGNGSDYLAFHADQLTSADHVTGGANYDIIEFDTAGTVAAGGLTNVTGVDELILNSGGTNVTLTNAMVAGSDNGVLVVLDSGSGNDTLNAGAVLSNRVVFESDGGNDSFTGGGGGDVALFTAAGLTSADTFAGGAGFDILELTTAGTVGASAFTGFSGVDELFLTLSGNNITLNGGAVASSDNGVFVVYDQAGGNVVNASAATLGGRVVFTAIAGDHDTYTGGTGSDFFQFADANLNATDTLAGGGGAGTDFLQVTTAATVTAADLANVSQLEVVQLLAGGSIALAANVGNAGGSLEADGTAAVDSIDGSAVSAYGLVIKGNGGADTLKGGAGNDQVFLPDTGFVAIDGNGGIDKIVLTAAFNGQTFDLSAQASKITDVEAITLEGATGATLHLAPADIPLVNASTNLFYVVGGSDDHVLVDGTWTALETGHVNLAVSATHTFTHYHNSNGSDLYVDEAISDVAISTAAADTVDPVAKPDVGTAVEDVVTTVTGNVLTNDTDDNPLTVTTTGVFAGTYGNLSLGSDGSYTYTLGVTPSQAAAVQALAAGTVRTDQFSYTITDQSPPNSSSTLTISVYGTDDAPTATAAVVSNATEDTAYSFNVATLFTDVDSVPAADTLTYSVAGLPSGLSFSGSTITGTPTNDDVGSYTVSVTANDGHSGSLTRTFAFSVANTNDAPVGSAASYTINEDTPLAGAVTGTDVDGDSLIFSLVAGSASNGAATVNPNGTFTFTPATNFNGDASFQFKANEGTADSAPQTVTIHITPVNDAPVAASAGNATSGSEDTAITGSVPAGSDVDDSTPSLTYQLVSGPSTTTEGSLTFNTDGTFSFTPVGNFNGAVAFSYRVVDPHGAHSDPQTFTITVNPANDAPAGTAASYTINEDTPLAGSVAATDVDGDSLTFSLVAGSASNGAASVNPDGTFTFTPTANFNGDASFQFKANDGTANSAPQTITIHVTPVNDAPVANADTTFTTPEDTPLSHFAVLANDADVEDGAPVTVATVNGTPIVVNGTIAVTGGSVTLNADQTLTFTPTLNSTTNAFFVYTAKDSAGAESAPAMVTIDVTPVNDAPTATPDTVTTLEDTPITFNVLGNDSDVDGPFPLAISKINGSAFTVGAPISVTGGTATVNANGTITFAPTANLNGTGAGSFTYTPKDGSGLEAASPATVTINVTAVNDAPQTNFDAFTVAENGPAAVGNVLANDSDVDGPNLQVTAFTVIVGGTGSFSAGSTATGASGATLSVAANGAVTLTQGTAYDSLGDGESAQILFTYDVSDNGAPAKTASDAAQILVNGVNEAPTLSLGSPLATLEVASSSPIGIAVAAATASVTDEEGKIAAIEVDISSGYQDGTASTGERAQLNAFGDFALSLLGGSANFVDNGNHGTLTVSFPTPVTPSQAAQVLKQIDYFDQIGDFTLAIAQDDTRTISVRVQDHDGVWSNTAVHGVNIAADVVDGTGDGTFVGGRFNDTIDGAAGNDTLTGGKGNDTLIGGSNSAAGDTVNYDKETNPAEVSETGTHGAAVNLSGSGYDLDAVDAIYDPSHLVDNPAIAAGQASDTYGDTDTLSGIENVVGTKYDDVIVDEKTVSNSYSGGEAAETNGDTVVFGATLGPDIGNPSAPYFRVQPTGVQGDDFTVQYFDPAGGGSVVATDTLTDIEHLVFANGTLNAENPVWVLQDGYLVGTFTSVKTAVESLADNLVGGNVTVEIGHGTTPPASYAEGTIDVTRAMTIKGIGAQQQIHATDGVDLFVVAGAATGTVRFDNLALSDDGVGPTADYGIRFAGTYDVNANATLQVSHVSVAGFEQTGMLVNGGGTTMNVAVDHSTFSGSGGAANSGGSGDVLFFEFTGAAALDHVTVTGTTSGSAATTADYGIQFAGFHDSNDAIANAIGAVSLSNVTVTGNYDHALVYFQGYNNFSGLSFAATQIGDAASTANWTGLFVEPVSTGGAFTPSGTTSTLDLSNVALAGTYGWQTTFQLPGGDLILGEPTNDHIIGSASNDAIRTLTGNDTIEAGNGDDLIIYDTLPGAKHTVDGGTGTDTEAVFGTAGAETFNVNAISATQLGINIVAGTGPASTVAADSANYEVATTAVEEINIQTGNGGDNVVITGDLHGSGVATSTITVVGGTGNDTVDASGMLNAVDTGPGDDSRVGIDFTGGAGNDTFISNSIGTNDRFDGGANTDTADYGHVSGGGVSVNLGAQSASDNGGSGVGTDTLIGVENAIGSAQHDVLVGSSAANTLTGGGGDDSLAGNAGADSLVGGSGTDTADYSLESGTNGVTVNLALNTATDTFGDSDTLTSIENATGTSHADTLIGGAGANVLSGLGGNDTLTGTGNDTLVGGTGDDTYYAHASDTVTENFNEGTDEVRATESYTLSANVENLTLLDNGASDTQTFENFGLGPIIDGENGWKMVGPANRDEGVVDLGGNKVFHMSSDPASGDFGGPYSPALSVAAGEPATSADFSGQAIKFDFQPVSAIPDGSRLEVDFGKADGTDRNNFLVLESTGDGIRIAVAEPNNTNGDFTGPGSGNSFPNDWRELVSGVDPTTSHTLEMRLEYLDGPDNDVIAIYLDGKFIGSSTTFENFRDLAAPVFGGATHLDNAEANQTSRVFFRAGFNGQPQDGPGGDNQGFYFDNVTNAVYNNIDGTGNGLDNVITGNSGDNTLWGEGGNDQLIGGAGVDTAKYDDASTNYAVTYTTDAHGFVTGAAQVHETGPVGAVDEGTDTLSGIERLAFSGLTLDFTQRVQLFDGANHLVGTFDHIADAMTAASDGDTIRLAAGSYSEFVDVTKDVTIAGANSGTPGADPGRGAESVLMGGVRVSHAGATLDGVKIHGTYDSSAIDGTDVDNGLFVTASNVTIANSLFDGSGLGDVRPFSTTGSVAGLDFNHNKVVHWDEGAYITAGATGTIAANTFDHDGNGVLTESVSMIITGNAFSNMVGSQVAALPFVDTDVSTFVLADNTFDNNSQPVSIYPNAAGAQTITGTVFSDKLKGGDNGGDHGLSNGPLTFHGGAGNDIVYGSDANDTLLDGGAGNDQIAGDGGNDTLHGGGGNDALYGGLLAGADAGKDSATYDDARANYTVAAASAGGFVTAFTDVTETVVTGTDEGHDTLSGIEVLQFSDVTLDLTQNVQLFDSSNKLIGTFDHIQDAVDAAAAHSGTNETIRLREGTYTEQVTIDGTAGSLAGLTIVGADTDANPSTGVTIQSPAVLGVNGFSDHWNDNVRAGIAVKNVSGVTIANVTVDGNYAGDTTSGSNGDQVAGIAYLHASGTIDNVHVEHTSNSAGGGLFGLQHGAGILSDNGTAAQQSLTITNSLVDTFQKTGFLVWNTNVDLRDNAVTGIGATALTAQNAVQIGGSQGTIGAAGHGNTFAGVGYTGGTFSSTDLIAYEPTGALTITANTFNGTGNPSALTVGLDLTDVDSSVTVTVTNNAFGTAGHGLLDGIDAYTFDGSVGLGSDPVMSGNTFTEIAGDGIFLDPEFVVIPPAFTTGTAFTETGTQFADVLHGSNGADNFSGGAGNDDLQGRGGADTIHGDAGNDTITWAAGDGNDQIFGGADSDTLDVAANGHNLTLTASGSSFTVSQDDSPATNSATVTEVEDVHITATGGETITLVGDFTAAGVDVNSIIVDGSAGTTGETVDASGMTSTQHIDFTGGSGNDTFIESDAAGNDRFAGGGGVDTVDFSHETTGAITVDLSNAAAQNTGNAGMDTFTDVENAIGTSFADTITGNAFANMLVGGAGADTFTGGAGNDTIYGGTAASDTSASDKAIFSGSSDSYAISFDPFAAGDADGIDATVNGPDGTDLLHGIEFLQFGNGTIDLTKSVLLFDSANHLIGTFDHIQDAVNAADGSGDTIKVRNGTYVEQVTVDASKDGLKIIGESEAGVVVQAPNVLVANGTAPSNGRSIDGVIVVDGADNVQVETLTVDGALKGGAVVGASNPTMVGVSYLNATGGVIDHVTVTHVRESDAGFGVQRNLGIFISNSNPSPASPTTPSDVEKAALKTIEISHTTVTDFQKGGIVVSFANASIHDNTVTGHGLTGLTAQNGIQLAGSTGSVDGNTVTGIGYNNPNVAIGYAILTFNNRDVTIDGNHITGTGVNPLLDSSGGIAAIGSTGVVVTNNDIHQVLDAADVYATPSFVDALAPSSASNPGGVFDFSSNAVDADVPFSVFFQPFAGSTDVFNVTGTNRDDELHGGAAADTLNGGGGNDILDGRGGADTIDGGAGNDVILIASQSEFAAGETIEGGADSDTIRFTSTTANATLALSSAVTGVENVTISDAGGDASGTTALNIDASAVTSALTITGNDGANSLIGTAQGDTLNGGGGNDLLTGGNGADAIHGGSGFDTAVYTTAYAGHSVAWDGTTATVTGSTDTGVTGDAIDGVGKLQFTDKTVWLVNDEAGSEYTTLAQLFDDNMANGEAGNGDIIILDDGTYVGDVTVNKAVTILGPNAGIAGTGSRAAESVIQGQLQVTAGATIDGIEVLNTSNNATQFIGVRIQNTAADVTVKNSLFYSTGPNGSAEDRGVNMDTTVSGHVTIADNLFGGAQQGANMFSTANWQRGIWSDGGTSQLDIIGNTFDHVRSGLNLDGLNNATTNVSGNTFLSDGTGIAVGGNYVGNPAALSLTAIHNNSFNNVAEDLNVQNFTTDVSFDATATNNSATEAGTPVFFVDGGRAADTLTGTAGVDVLLGHALDGMVGNDSNTLTGKGGNDILIGASGTGTDTAVYSAAITAADITASAADANPFLAGTQAGWIVNGGAEGTDTLSEIEIVDGAGAGRFLLVGNGGYDSITAALAAAVAGDTIVVAPGTFTESVTVDKDVTILGANHGIAGDGVRGAETILDGGFRITASGVTIDGFDIIHGRSDFGQQRSGVFIDGARADVTVENSIIDQVTSHAESFQHGIISTYNADTPDLQVLDNLIENWNEGTYLNPGVHDSTFDGNTFVNNANHLVFDNPQDLTITNNDFGASLGSKIVPQVYDNPTDLEAVLGLAGNTFANDGKFAITTIPLGPDGQVVLGTSIGERIDAEFSNNPNFNYSFDGRGGDDTLIGGGGNDTLDGGAGSDTVDGGAGNDTIIGSADGVNDNYTGGSGTDTIDYSALTSAQTVSVNLGTGFASGTAVGTDTLTGIENIAGGEGNDSLFGSSGNNVIHGNGGADNIVGGGGSDTLYGDDGNDTLNGGVNDFTMTPSAANDVLFGGAGTDTFRFEGRFGDDAIGQIGTPDWTDGEDMVFVGYAAHTPIIADVTGGVLITIDDGSVASSVFVAGAVSAQMQQLISGSDLIIH